MNNQFRYTAPEGEKPLDNLVTDGGYASIFRLVLGLSVNTPYILFDEPVLGLDAQHRDLFYRLLIEKYSQEPCTILISTHLIGDIERVLDEVIFLKDGNVVLHDTTDNIREREGKSIDALFREMFRATW